MDARVKPGHDSLFVWHVPRPLIDDKSRRFAERLAQFALRRF
jgi:hypothetical protein